MQLSTALTWDQAKTIWAGILNPIVTSPFQPQFIYNISLAIGSNTINHKLGRVPIGWFLVDVNTPATIYRGAASSTTTITLYSNLETVIGLGVY